MAVYGLFRPQTYFGMRGACNIHVNGLDNLYAQANDVPDLFLLWSAATFISSRSFNVVYSLSRASSFSRLTNVFLTNVEAYTS